MTNLDISAAYVGLNSVDKVYLGSETIWPTTPPGPVPYDEQYFTIEANSAGTLNIAYDNFMFSKNGGPWTTGVGNQTLSLNAGDKVRFKSDSANAQQGMFSANTLSFQVYGNIESMEYGDNFIDQTAIRAVSAFTGYFSGCTALTSAANLILPATSLTHGCYRLMFKACSSLVMGPAVLPSTTLIGTCYYSMFSSCSNLVKGPVLPASTYRGGNAYDWFYSDCTSLQEITCLLQNPPSSGFQMWVRNVPATGTFYKAPGAEWTTGFRGIPDGWTVVDYVEPNN